MSFILCEKKGPVALVTLNRPFQLNAFNYASLVELGELIEHLSQDPNCRVVIFTGAGEKAFSVGADLKERETLTQEEVIRNLDKINEVFNAISELPQPTVAAINGYAFGGGLELALACDFRFAARGVQMGLTETGLAIIPGAGGTQRLPRIINQTKALELILTAKRITAEEALTIGLLSGVAEGNELLATAEQFVEPILSNGPVAIRAAKRAITHGMESTLSTGLQIERSQYEQTLVTADRLEALKAFKEKRKPNFMGR